MTDTQKVKINQMRTQGSSYGDIAVALGLPKSTVKSFCRRAVLTETEAVPAEVEQSYEEPSQEPRQDEPEPLSGTMDGSVCRACGEPLMQISGRRRKFFCSKECRVKWWRTHPDASNGKVRSTLVCPGCGQEFTVHGNRIRKYCSHECYISARFGGKSNE